MFKKVYKKYRKMLILLINKKNNYFFFKICFIFFIFMYMNRIKIFTNKYEKKNEIHFYKYYDNIKENYIYFNIYNLSYVYSAKFQLVKVEYAINFFENNNTLILPSDLTLYRDLHIICHIELINSKLFINSLSNIYKNNYFKCIEFYNINEKINFGIIIYQSIDNNNIIKSFIFYNYTKALINQNMIMNSYKIIDYIKDNNIFDPLLLNNKYFSLIKKMNRKKINETLKLKKTYITYPFYNIKRKALMNENEWKFINIFNNYFCSCKGLNCLISKISQKCKYYFYISIIDNNRNVYDKTDYLFIDFILNQYSSDDVFPIFKEMEKQNLPVHYITEHLDIYKEFCSNKIRCLKIISVNNENYIINGDFIEKYLTLFLKLKIVITAAGIYYNYINNLFYNIEYITYICVGHGVSFFKHFLYADYSCYGHKMYDKIILPPSKKLISMAKNYGWSEENIIKINLPRWDKYVNDYNSIHLSNNSKQNQNNSIYIMFTWRQIKKHKKISKYYFKNILNLINNDLLKNALKENKIIEYFTIHHRLSEYKTKFQKNSYIKYIEENQISNCLSKINLIISDFSSIIFDIIYRRKPYIIYIPDANDPDIKNIYEKNYYELIESIKNETITFENKFFDLNELIDKIINYIHNNFKLEKKLEEFYDSFKLKPEKTIGKFINYITR